MKRANKIVLILGTALTLGLGAAAVSGHPFDGGARQGYGMGPGMMGGAGQGYGMGPGMMGGAGQGYGMGPGMMGGAGQGYGMGSGMMGGAGQGYGMGPGMMGGAGQGYGMAGQPGNFSACDGDADEGLTGLKTELGITAQQDAAWQEFVKSATQQSDSRKAFFAKLQQEKNDSSAPAVFAQQAEIMKQRQTDMQASATALKNLYATLTAEQKAIADQRLGVSGAQWQHGRRTGPRGNAF